VIFPKVQWLVVQSYGRRVDTSVCCQTAAEANTLCSMLFTSHFWVTICNTVRRMLSDCCLSCLSVCDVGVLRPNGWMDQDATWYGGKPRLRRRFVRCGLSSPP